MHRLRRFRATAALLAPWIAASALTVMAPTQVGADGIVTALLGKGTGGTEPLGVNQPIAPGQDVELVEDGRCSVLLTSNAVLQMCDEARVRFRDEDGGSRAIVELDRGMLKATVESGGAARQVEIHTPAAIATVLGTVVHVEVDPDTGDTTVSSIESRVRVEMPGSSVGSVVIGPGQQVVMAGNPPGAVHEFDPSVLRSSQRCLDEGPLHSSAARAARERDQRNRVDEIAMRDVPKAVDRIDVAAPPGGRGGGGGGKDPTLIPELPPIDLCNLEPTACVPLFPEVPARPAACGAIPGDHCL